MDLGISFKNIREGKGKSVYALSKETGVSENHSYTFEKSSVIFNFCLDKRPPAPCPFRFIF